MDINMEGITTYEEGTGLIIESDKPLYIFANREGYDFQYMDKINNHYFNNPSLSRKLVERNGIHVITTVEQIQHKFFTNITVLLDVALDNITLVNLYRTLCETIATTSWDVGAINNNKLDNELGNFYNTIFIACKSEASKPIPFDISLFYEVKEITDEALRESFNDLGYPQTIMKYLNNYGVTFKDMENVALKYIGNDISCGDFSNKLNQVLSEVNVASSLTEAICLYQMYKHKRILQLNAFNRLEMLQLFENRGLNIANQITAKDVGNMFAKIKEGSPNFACDELLDNLLYGLISGCIVELLD